MNEPADEQWLFRIDFKQYGPVEGSYLVELLEPPRLVRRIEVRPAGREGDEWFAIGPEDDFASAARHFGCEPRLRLRWPGEVEVNLLPERGGWGRRSAGWCRRFASLWLTIGGSSWQS